MFIAGAVLKALDINLFIVQISYYHVFQEQTLLAASALGTLFLETLLGIALLVGLRCRGLTTAAVLGLLVVFTALIAYAWRFYDLQDCGCFGPIEISPAISIAKNVVLALLAIAAWIGTRRSPVRFGRSVPAVLAVLCTVTAGLATAYAGSNIERLGNIERPLAEFAFEEEGLFYDLAQGDYLVALLSMGCEHCQASVADLNNFVMATEEPAIVALCFEEGTDTIETFRAITQPLFPLHSMGDRIRKFYSLVGEGQVPPRFLAVRDGAIIKDWYETAPSVEDVLLALGEGQG